MYEFEIAQPKTIEEAVTALKEEDAQALGGGQTLIPTLRARLAMPSTLVSLGDVGEMKGICTGDDGALCIGGGTTHNTVAKHRNTFTGLAGLAAHIGDPAVRNRGTIGGSLANNDPSACYPAAVLACNANVVTDRRIIPADEFFDGLFTTLLEEGEIVTEVRFPVPLASNYQKFVQPASRFALVGVFVARFADRVRVAVTGASEDGVFRWREAEDALSNDFTAGALENLTIAPDDLIEDVHGSRGYRAHLIKVMTSRAIVAAA